MKKKLLSLSVALALVATCSFAQLSERENDATMVKLGARPQSGNMALTFGTSFGSTDDNKAEASLFKGNFLTQGDFLTFKYFNSDDLAIRFAIRLSKHSTKIKGEVADSTAYSQVSGVDLIYGGTFETKVNKREYVIVPGVEKHFSSSNIVDVYVGADLYLGFGKEDSSFLREYGVGAPGGSQNGDFTNFKSKTSNTIVGIGGIVGFNVFIAHLPVSVGIEYGLNLKWTLGGKTKISQEDRVGGVKVDADYILDSDDDNSLQYDKLKKSRFDMDTNQDVRIVANIYFGQ